MMPRPSSTKLRRADKPTAVIPHQSSLILQIAIRSIHIPANHRKHSRADIEGMAESVAARGQLQPIEIERISDDPESYRLIFGALRLQGMQFGGYETIAAIVTQPDELATDATRRLRSIAENMARVRLDALDRAIAIADWCDIYRAAKPHMKTGPRSAETRDPDASLKFRLAAADLAPGMPVDLDLVLAADFEASFSEAAQAFLHISRAGVFRALKIASIPSLQRDRMALHWMAKSEGELYKLATLKPAERQVAVIDLILADRADSVDDAIDQLDGRTRNKAPKWEVIHQTFSRLPPPDQDRFFDMNSASVDRWQAKRGRR